MSQPPHEDNTLSVIIDALVKQVQHSLDAQEEMRRYFTEQVAGTRSQFTAQVESLRVLIMSDYVTESRLNEKLAGIKEDVAGLQKQMSTMEISILSKIEQVSDKQQEKQKESYTRIIGIQATILFIIVSSLIGVWFQYFHK